MPRRRAITEPDRPTQVNIVPMIDVTFAILAFFIMSTLTLTRLEALSVNLPQAKTAQPQLRTKVNVSIDPQGQLFINRQPVAADQIVESIQRFQVSGQSLTVILHADRGIDYGNAVAVLDQVRQIPGVKIALATKRPQEKAPR